MPLTFVPMMLRRTLSVFLMIVVLSANFSRFYVWAGFGLNQKYITANFCENRNKPQLHCNGRCYLMKKLKLAAAQDRSNEREIQKNLIQEGFLTTGFKLKKYLFLVRKIETPHLQNFNEVYSATIFQPPPIGLL
ncbi:MAG: hypothetical protein EOP43_03780 [Sphingobacteriaceae bacterium]|nr:MAG: hypothetical protein EOP43_03780 [Sphingobacteriaceae bacterium]